MAMKTVFITIFDGLVSKNILRTGIINFLQKEYGENINFILFVPVSKVEYYKKDINIPGVFVEVAPEPSWPNLEKILFKIKEGSLLSKTAFFRKKNSPYRFLRIIYSVLTFFRNYIPLDFFLENIFYLIPDFSFNFYFVKYSPDLIFSTNPVSSTDMRLMRKAKKEKKKSVVMIKSWDNIVGRPYLFLYLNNLIVQNGILKDEAIEILKIPEEKIIVTGFPQFDIYKERKKIIKKETFFKELELDKSKKLILFSATGYPWTPHEVEVLELLSKNISNLIDPIQVLVRLHPKYEHSETEISKLPHMIVWRPGYIKPETKLSNWEYKEKDILYLMSALYYSDICINTGSTMAIESIIFDKPTIAIAFDGKQKNMSLHKSVRRFYLFDHNRKLVDLGGEDIAGDIDELIISINKYLKDPSIKSKERSVTRDMLCYKLDGCASRRVAEVIIENLK